MRGGLTRVRYLSCGVDNVHRGLHAVRVDFLSVVLLCIYNTSRVSIMVLAQRNETGWGRVGVGWGE